MDNQQQSTENVRKRKISESQNSQESEDSSQTQDNLEKQTRSQRKKINIDEIPKEDYKGKLTEYEKMDLFNALIQHGSSDIPLLNSYVPTKSEDTIKHFIFSYKRYARYSISEGQQKAPIDKWLDFLTTEPLEDREKLQDLSRALKFIALFEPHTEESNMLSDSYKLLSDCVRGETPKHLNPVTSLFLIRQFQQFIRVLKNQEYARDHKYLETYKKRPACYAGKNKKIAENKVDLRISNPLKIPDSLLDLKKMST